MDRNEIEYRGYKLLLQAAGSGWRVLIYPPGEANALARTPATPDMFRSAEAIREAKKIVDEVLASSP